MNEYTPAQMITAEHKVLASNLTSAIRQLRKHGFHFAQDPLAATLDEGTQRTQATQAACLLLNLRSTVETRDSAVVQDLATALREHAKQTAGRKTSASIRRGAVVPVAIQRTHPRVEG